VYNIASGVETTIVALAELVNRLTGNPTPLEFRPPRPWDHSGKRFGSTEKAKRALGFEAEVDLATGVQRTVEWTRASLPLIERCIARHATHMAAAPH
jgi:nucleoside-diphosphate-sugar epimerase